MQWGFFLQIGKLFQISVEYYQIIFAQNLMKAVGFIILLLAGQLNHLNLGGLQVDDISIKITAESTKQLYQLDKN